MGRPRGTPSTVVSIFLPTEDVARLDAALKALAAKRKHKDPAESRSSVLRPYVLAAVQELERRAGLEEEASPETPETHVNLEAELQAAEYAAVEEWRGLPAENRPSLSSLTQVYKDRATATWAAR